MPDLSPDIARYHESLEPADREICEALANAISKHIPEAENKVWHRHPVWFLDGNPIVGYSKLKDGVRLLFWSGQSFDEQDLIAEGSFKAAEFRYSSAEEIRPRILKRWLEKARAIQWDYKNIVRRKGKLERLK